MPALPTATTPRAAQRHVTIFFSDLTNFSVWTERLGDVQAGRLANRLLEHLVLVMLLLLIMQLMVLQKGFLLT